MRKKRDDWISFILKDKQKYGKKEKVILFRGVFSMNTRFVASLLLLTTAFYAPALWAVDAQVELNAANPNYTNTGTITTSDGYGLWLNGINSFSSEIKNTGSILTTGTGFGIYATPYQTRGIVADINNTGLIQRIQLEETNGSRLLNGAIGGDGSANAAMTQGSVLMGTNASILNYGGTFSNLPSDTGLTKGNLISLGKNSSLNNGVEPIYVLDTKGNLVLSDVIFHQSQITTDKIQFSQTGALINGSTIHNKSIAFGQKGAIHNIGDAYDQTNIGAINPSGATITSGLITMGDESVIYNEMGTNLNATTVSMGNNSTIVNGAGYALDYQKKLVVTQTAPDGSSTQEEYPFVPVPKSAQMTIQNAAFGSKGTLKAQNNSVYTGETLSFGENGTLSNSGSSVSLTNSSGTGILSFNNGGMIQLDLFQQAAVSEPVLQADNTVQLTEVLAEKIYIPKLTVNSLNMKQNGTINLNGGIITADSVSMGDNAKLTLTKVAVGDVTYVPSLTANNQVSFGNFASVQNDGTIKAPLVTFKDDGKLVNNSLFDVDVLKMGQRSYITTAGGITSNTTVGSDSQAVLTSAGEPAIPCFGCSAGGSITGGFQKANGATNVQIVSDVGYSYFGYLKGGVNVDSILINKNSLRVSGDIRGQINMNSDTVLKLVDTDVHIYDAITKTKGATNTTVEVALSGDNRFYKTTNTINVDHIKLTGGGIEITRPVQVTDITLGANTTVRLVGNYVVGDLRELDGEAVNTTLDIAAGKGKSIDTSGEVVLDRVVVESGSYNVLHTLKAVYSDAGTVLPSAHEQGIELGTDSAINIYADSKVNRIVRQQDVLALGQQVSNTTLNVNGNKLTVERFVDVDNLNLNRGVFEFLNEDKTNVVNVTNAVRVSPFATLAGSGTLNLKSGQLTVLENGRLSVSTQTVEDKPVGQMNIVQSTATLTDSSKPAAFGNATVNLEQGSILDLRADGAKSDKINVKGTVNIANGSRVIVRNIQTNQEYELLSATQLNGNMDKLKTSFLWTGTSFSKTNNTLSLKITGIQTLNQGISSTKYSKNAAQLAQALTSIKSSVASNTVDPFLDKVFFADSASEAVAILDEYSPEGYLNTQQAALRTNRMFRESALSELDSMRSYQDSFIQRPVVNRNYNPYYYGRPGYEHYYASQNRGNPYSRTRTDKGGMWAKPFMISTSQDNKDNMSGYDFDSYGLTAGIDRKFGALSLGIMGLYADGDMEQKNKVIKSDITTYGAGIYGSYQPRQSRQFIDFYALWSESSNKATHQIASLGETSKADFDITTYSAGADVGYDIVISRNLTITPKIGIDYTSIQSDDIVEKGNGVSLMKISQGDLTSIQTPLEVKASFNYGNETMRFKPEVHARWAHEFGDTASSGKGLFVQYAQPFNVEGLNVDKDNFTVGGSLLWLYSASEFQVKYDYDFSSSSTGHAINLGYKYLF